MITDEELKAIILTIRDIKEYISYCTPPFQGGHIDTFEALVEKIDEEKPFLPGGQSRKESVADEGLPDNL